VDRKAQVTAQDWERLRALLEANLAARRERARIFTPPRYDEEYFEAMEILDRCECSECQEVKQP